MVADISPESSVSCGESVAEQEALFKVKRPEPLTKTSATARLPGRQLLISLFISTGQAHNETHQTEWKGNEDES
jgi:hypothetical protein